MDRKNVEKKKKNNYREQISESGVKSFEHNIIYFFRLAKNRKLISLAIPYTSVKTRVSDCEISTIYNII